MEYYPNCNTFCFFSVYSSRQKYNRYAGSSGGTSGNNKIRTGGRKSKASIEDPDYLAHGTGIPR